MNKYEAQLQNSLMLKNNLEKIVRKLIVSIFLTFVVLVSLVAEVFALTASEVFEKTSKSTVIVIASDSSGKDIAFGTGVVLPNGKVVTNFHVVTDATKLRVTFEKLTFFATIEKSNKQRDLCTLSVPGLNANPATVGTSKEIKIGSKVYAIGTPKGLESTISEGIVSGLRETKEGSYIQTTAPVSPGSSGGGLFNEDGRLVGIISFQLTDGQNLNFAAPIEWVEGLSEHKQSAVKGEPSYEEIEGSYRLYIAKDFDGYLEHSLGLVKKYPSFAPTWNILGDAYSYLKQHQDAIDAYETALRIDPQFVEAWLDLGNVFRGLEQHQKAIDAYEKALRIDPQFVGAWLGLGNVYKDLKQHQKAIDAYEKALRIDPQYAKAWVSLGNVYEDLKQHQKAIDAYEKGQRIDPQYAGAWLGLGVTYSELKQHKKAIDAYEKFLRIEPQFAPAWFFLGVKYSELKQHKNAIDAYEKCLSIEPKSAHTWYELGSEYRILNDHDHVSKIYMHLKTLDSVVAERYFRNIVSH